MGKTTDAIYKFSDNQRQRRLLDSQIEGQNFDRALKLGELATKGVNVTETEGPRRLFGLAPGQRSLSMSFDPAQSLTYAKDKSIIDKNQALTQQAQAKAASLGKDDGLTVGQRTARDKAITGIFEAVEANKVKRRSLADARAALPNVPQGLMGKAEIGFKKMFKPDDPILQDWQKIKIIGTDAQLLNTAKTKGAISDQEMRLFAQAAANDDIISAPRLKPVLAKIEAMINAEEAGMFGAYQKNYGEDPRTWFEGNSNVPSFNTPEEAEASGVKGPVLIGGRKAVIE